MKNKLSNQLKMLLFLLFTHSYFSGISQNANSLNSEATTIAILSQALRHPSLWNEVPANYKQISNYTILHHGVELNLPDGITIGELPVTIIEKSEIPLLEDWPYFIIHTFNIETNEALIRLYLNYKSAGITKTSNVELIYKKDADGHWTIENTSF